jgi:hypothetical protein
MLGEVRLIVAAKEARLVLKIGETLIEEELWTFDRKISKSEAREVIEAAFHDAYDLMQFSVHGDT